MKHNAIDWLSVLPTICFGFQGHIAAVPLYAELRGRSLKKFDMVIALTLLACVLIYNLTGWAGYASYGECTKSDVLLNLDQNRTAVVIARVCVAISVVTTYAILHFCARKSILDEYAGWQKRREAIGDRYSETIDKSDVEAIEDQLQRSISPQSKPKSSSYFFMFITVAWNCAVLLVALAVPDIGKLVSIMGNLCAFFMFQYPGASIISLQSV